VPQTEGDIPPLREEPVPLSAFEVQVKTSVERDLRKLGKDALRRVLARIGEFGGNPFPRHAVKLSGAERLYRVRVGDYRIIFEVDPDARVVTVHYVPHRSVAYDRA